MTDLFDSSPHISSSPAPGLHPLADLLRPQKLEDIAGQDHLLGENGVLTRLITGHHLPSLILWGPPGCGKTTIARLLSQHASPQGARHFEQISAIFTGVAELRQVFEQAKIRRKNGVSTLLFVDEIHRFNKSQQDAFLPVVENGTITLIGATTENPSFELNAALLSRMQVLVLKRLDDTALENILHRAENLMQRPLPITDRARELLRTLADGDGRYILTLAQQIFSTVSASKPDQDAQNYKLNEQDLLQLIQRRAPLYDKGEDSHYNLISALHKSVRGSDVQAALYWFSRMLDGGEDPHFIARRMVRMAVEDIGLADPSALTICINAWQAFERLGSPEGELALSQALIYLATAPKSNANYTAYKSARKFAAQHGSLMPPKHILNAPTKLMKNQGYGHDYKYDHDEENGFSEQDYFPENVAPRPEFYQPVPRGFERDIAKRLDYWDKLRETKNTHPETD